ncbi:uncharacterized protein LOC129747893 [Uranotaenia lowii]|uniref:uncharacterized protein LOC129747893 n=1 Tax=Uranotaenia lowii TaxID=190385 RepID=UPI00247968AA|nr:uncharacterized protein LOC129747893 [Uranotaenia lowii]
MHPKIILLLCSAFWLNSINASSVSRFKRQQFRPLDACTVSHQEIDKLIAITKNLDAVTREMDYSLRSGFDSSESSDRCTKQLAEFRGNVHSVMVNYKTIDRQKMSQAQYERAKSKYQSEIQRLLRKLDNLKRDVEDSYRGEVEKLRSNIQHFRGELDENLALLEQERMKNRSAFLRLCIANIRSGRVNEAINDLRDIGDVPYDQIVTQVYEHRLSNVKLILDFLEVVDMYFEPVKGYEVLFNLMKENNQLNGMEGQRLLIHLMALSMADDQKNSRKAHDLLKDFKESV